MNKIITFTNVNMVHESYAPVPAKKVIPEWYKNMSSYTKGGKQLTENFQTSGTIKKCIPVFDAITMGYIIPTYVDLSIETRDDAPFYAWPSHDAISFHPIEQAPEHPAMNGFPYPKWINPWGIKTAPGYSCLFVTPFHRESEFVILPGVVDTDTYSNPVNFPFVLRNPQYEGIIPAGTPLVQVIPFKRENFEMQLGLVEDLAAITQVKNKLRSKFFDAYKTIFWSRKNYS